MGDNARLELAIPSQQRRWVRVALLVACLGYGSLLATRLLTGAALNPSEVLAFILCLLGFAASRKKPNIGGLLGLWAIWLEIMWSLMASPEGLAMDSIVILPVLTVAASLLYGARGAWGLSLLSGATAPLLVHFSSAHAIGVFASGAQISRLLILEAALLSVAAFTATLFRTIGVLVARERENAERLEHSQRMEAIGQLAGGVAHDFNNLLTAIGGSAFVLRDSIDDEAQQIAEDLESAVERGAALTRQLLTFARRDIVQEEVVDVGATLTRVKRLVSRLVGEKILVEVFSENDCRVLMDEGQLEQVILNLAANARDAVVGRGTISISAGRDERSVRLTVQDDGAGIAPEHLARIFEPFFSTKARNKGTGLGLSTVHGIVHKWGGSIEVRSTATTGTVFTISWPLASGDSPQPLDVSRSVQSLAAGEHILLVEDDAHARRFLDRLLRRQGYQVTVASSGEEALLLHRDGLRPDLLLSDVIMPGMSGPELCQRLRKDSPNLPALLISGYLDDVLEQWPFDTTHELLPKPFAPETLLARLEERLGASSVDSPAEPSSAEPSSAEPSSAAEESGEREQGEQNTSTAARKRSL